MNDQNLKKPGSTSEARKWGHNGGVKSGQVRRERKAARDIIDKILSTPLSDNMIERARAAGIPLEKNATYMDYLAGGIVIRAIKRGTPSDLEVLTKILGE